MNSLERSFSGAPWETKVAYCRAVRAGHHIYVSGTAPVADDGSVYGPGDGCAQAKRCLELIQEHIQRLGASMEHVTRTRMFVTDIGQWEAFGRAHHEFFAEHPPATTMVEVKALIDPAMLIEIEAEAVVP